MDVLGKSGVLCEGESYAKCVKPTKDLLDKFCNEGDAALPTYNPKSTMFVATTTNIAYHSSKNETEIVPTHKNPRHAHFCTAIAGTVSSPQEGCDLIKSKLITRYPYLGFTMAPTGKFITWPQNTRSKGVTPADEAYIVRYVLRTFMQRRIKENQDFANRLDNLKRQKAAMCDVDQLVNETKEMQMSDDEFVSRYTHTPNRESEKKSFNLDDISKQQQQSAPSNAVYETEEPRTAIMPKSAIISADGYLGGEYVLLSYIGLLDDEIAAAPSVVKRYPWIRGVLKVSDSDSNIAKLSELGHELNTCTYDRVVPHHICRMNKMVPYPPLKHYMTEISTEGDTISEKFSKKYFEYQKRVKGDKALDRSLKELREGDKMFQRMQNKFEQVYGSISSLDDNDSALDIWLDIVRCIEYFTGAHSEDRFSPPDETRNRLIRLFAPDCDTTDEEAVADYIAYEVLTLLCDSCRDRQCMPNLYESQLPVIYKNKTSSFKEDVIGKIKAHFDGLLDDELDNDAESHQDTAQPESVSDGS